MLAMIALAAVAGGTGVVVTDNPLNRSFKKWMTDYSDKDKQKLYSIGKIYHACVFSYLNENNRIDENSFENITIGLEPSGYPVGANELHDLQIYGKISMLCQKQKSFTEFRIFSDNIKTPENLIIEDFKKWLVRLSNLNSDSFDENLKKEVEKRVEYLQKIIILDNLRDGFIQIITDLNEFTRVILNKVNEKIANYKCQNTLNSILIEGRDLIENIIGLLYQQALQNGMHNLDDTTISGLARNSQILNKSYYGRLILYIISADNFDEIYYLGNTPLRIDEIPKGQSNLEKKYAHLAEKIRNLVFFIKICHEYKKTEKLGGSLLVGCVMNDNKRIDNVCESFDVLVIQFSLNLKAINKCYDNEINRINSKIYELSKECCSSSKIKSLEENRECLRNHSNKMIVLSSTITQRLETCQQKLAEVKSFALISGKQDIRKLQDTMQGLVNSVCSFISNVRAIEYQDAIRVNITDNNRPLFLTKSKTDNKNILTDDQNLGQLNNSDQQDFQDSDDEDSKSNNQMQM